MEIVCSVIYLVDFSAVHNPYIVDIWIKQLRRNMSKRQWIRMVRR